MIKAGPSRWRVQRIMVRFVLAGGAAVAALVVTQGWIEGRSAANVVAVPMADVLVTARAVEAGAVIGPEDLRWQAWPAGAVAPGWLVRGRDAARLAGQVAPQRLAAGMPVTAAMAVSPGRGSIFAAAIRPGWRAVTIAVSPAAGLAGFAAPGDRVDVLLTQVIGNRRTAQTLLADLGVLGVDQRQRSDGSMTAPMAAASDVIAGATEEIGGAGGAEPPALVTLEVLPREAEALAVAAEMGKLSLVLRGPGREAARGGGRRWDNDVTGLPVAMLAAGEQKGVFAAPVAAVAAAAPVAVVPTAVARSGGVEVVYGLPQASAEPVK